MTLALINSSQPSVQGQNFSQLSTEGLDSLLSGIFNQSGPVSDPTSSVGGSAHVELVTDSLMRLMPTISDQDLEAALSFVSSTLQGIEEGSAEQSAKNQELIQQDLIAEQKKQMDDAEAKIKQAADAKAHETIWDKVRLAFEWIGAILAIAVGALLCATGNVALGADMIVGGVLGIISAINDTMIQSTGDGIAGTIAKETGGDPQKADQVFGYVLMGLAIAAAVASFGAGINLGSIASSVACTLSEALSEGAGSVSDLIAAIKTAATAARAEAPALTKTQTVLKDVASGGQSTTAAVDATSTAVDAGYNYQAATLQAAAQTDQALQERDQAQIDQLTATIKAVMQNMNSIFKSSNAEFSEFMSAMSTYTNAISSVRFAG